MRIKQRSEQYIRTLTEKLRKEMAITAPVTVKFLVLPNDIDANTTPYYSIDPKTKKPCNHSFIIRFNTNFIKANETNLKSDGITGMIVHELAHCRHFIEDKEGYDKHPHTDEDFRNLLRKYMQGRGDGKKDFHDAYQPEVNVRAAVRARKNSVAPSWLSQFWLYSCPNCGFTDAFITDLRTTQPKCEKCGYAKPLSVKLPVKDAAQLDIQAQKSLSKATTAREKDKRLLQIMTRYLTKNLTPQQRVKFEQIRNNSDAFNTPVVKTRMKHGATASRKRKPASVTVKRNR
jgi:hypothetical protein